ncbi:MAG: helix-turn-helix domain-containing protein [Raoultibacter sp.]
MSIRQTRNTKAAILDASTRLFSERGFAAVTVKDIAAEVGIKDASLYNHFKSKQEIFDTIIDEALAVLKEAYGRQGILYEETDDASGYSGIPFDVLREKILITFDYFFNDARIVQLRHLLVINQFESKKAGDAYRLIFIERPLALQKTVFEQLIATGEFEYADSQQLALEFYGPIFIMLHAETAWHDAKPIIAAHLESFYLTHTIRKELP